jgi:tRNA modification GTPase
MAVSLDPADTIAAVASPAGPALRGIIRLSGPLAHSIALAAFSSSASEALPPRAAILRGALQVDGLRPPLPVDVACWHEPRSYTGQNIAEIHLIGSPPLVELVLAHCLSRGARLAEPGEFTLRAFLNGRLDLTRAEAVLGVIDATNQPQLEAALEQLAGGLSLPIGRLRDRLLDVLSHLEANLDFVDEPDVDPLGRTALASELTLGANEMRHLTSRLSDRARPDGHPRVVLVGPPNVGKSRLFNTLAQADQAIVSPQAGTTRDYLATLIDCQGVTVLLVDTAGFETAADGLTAQAQAARAHQTAVADLVLDCRSIDGDETAEFALVPPHVPRLPVLTKTDLGSPRDCDERIGTSAATGAGLDMLRSAIAAALDRPETREISLAGTAARCRGSLVRAESALRNAAATLECGGGDELVALDLREAIDDLGQVVGAVVTDDILDRIFRRFCIGK